MGIFGDEVKKEKILISKNSHKSPIPPQCWIVLPVIKVCLCSMYSQSLHTFRLSNPTRTSGRFGEDFVDQSSS